MPPLDQRAYRDLRRPSAEGRGYGSKWVTAAAEFRRRNPLCLGCYAVGVRTACEVVDHIIPHRGDNEKFWDRKNWQPSCTWHHNAIKPLLEERYERGELKRNDLFLFSVPAVLLTKAKRKKDIGVDGWAV